MELQDLKDNLTKNSDIFDFTEGDGGIYIVNKRFNTEIHVNYDAIAKNDWDTIRGVTVCGKNVQHITRVTGYFTFIEGWNKGKIGELRDRHHSIVKE